MIEDGQIDEMEIDTWGLNDSDGEDGQIDEMEIDTWGLNDSDGEDGQIDEMEIDTWGLNDWRWRRWTDRWNGNRYMRFKWLKMEKMDR